MLFPEYIDKYDAVRLSYLERSSRYQALHALRYHCAPHFAQHELASIEVSDIEDFVIALERGKGLAPKTIKRIIGSLSAYLGFCVERSRDTGMVNMPKMFRFRRKRERKRVIEYLTPDDLDRLFKVVDEEPYKLMLLLAARTGMRIGELLGLKWCNVDLDTPQIHVRCVIARDGGKEYEKDCPKNGEERSIPISQSTADALRQTLRLGDHVFISRRTKKRPTYMGVYKALAKYNKRAGIKKHGWHLHRHTWATHAVAVTPQINDVRVMIGHKDLKQLLHYAHSTEGQGRSTIQALENLYNTPKSPERKKMTRCTPQVATS